MQRKLIIIDLIACSTCFGQHYAHHQEFKSIIQWLLPVVLRAVVFKLLVWCGAEGYVSGLQDAADAASCKPDLQTPDQQLENHSTKYHRQQPLYNTLELLMMGIVVLETCWASNKICNKELPLHLVGILFPQISYYFLPNGSSYTLNMHYLPSTMMNCEVLPR